MPSPPAVLPSQHQSVEQLLSEYATIGGDRFHIFFRRMRSAYPQDCIRGCIRALGSSCQHIAQRQILLWLCSGPDYLPALFDPSLLTSNDTRRAALILRDYDPQFFAKLARFLQDQRQPKSVGFICRVLQTIPVLGECGVLIPWLRALADHSEEQIRLQSAKAMCELRPTRAMVERQLQSPEPQTRADALEALWRVPGPEAISIFRFALSDSDHRVIANALVGLHLNRDMIAVQRMIELSEHPSPLYRLSMISAMVRVEDHRCRAALELLAADSYPAVREQAQTALAVYARILPLEVSHPHEQPCITNIRETSPSTEINHGNIESDKIQPAEKEIRFQSPVFRLI